MSNLSAGNKFQVKTQSQPQSGTAGTPAFLVVALLLIFGQHFQHFANIQKTSMLSALGMPHISQESQERLNQSRQCSRVKSNIISWFSGSVFGTSDGKNQDITI